MYTLNGPPDKLWTPTAENMLDVCAVRNPLKRMAWVIFKDHDYDAQGRCRRCGKVKQQVETALETRERSRNIHEL